MLKTNLSKAGFWSHGLLLVVTPNGFITKPQPANHLHQELKSFLFRSKIKGTADTAILQTPEGLMIALNNLPEEVVADAPQIRMNPAAAKFVKSYIRRNNEDLQKVKQRSEPYFKIIESVFRKYGLPVELKYLAVIESDLKSNAKSRVGARGPWQLMPSTARDMGLKVSRKVDERTYYYKSTVAAAKYIKSLYTELGDWLLVIAAYNGGNGTVEHAIRKSGSRNFWVLQHYLPAETRGHVKRFIGTHYFFEDHGSITTLTKAENLEHQKELSEFIKINQDGGDTKLKNYAGPDSYKSNTERSVADVGINELKKKEK